MNRYICSFIAAVLATITIVSCNKARKSETYRVLEVLVRTFYYQGRIYQNGGDDEMAMECFVRAVEEGDGAEDCLTLARIYFAQGNIYSNLYKED